MHNFTQTEAREESQAPDSKLPLKPRSTCHSKNVLGQKSCQHWIKDVLTHFFWLKEEFSLQPQSAVESRPIKKQACYDVDVPAVQKNALKTCQLTHHMDMGLLFIRPGLQTKTQQLKAKRLPNPVRHSGPLPTSVLIIMVSRSRFPRPSLK